MVKSKNEKKIRLAAKLLFLVVFLMMPHKSFYWEDGFVDLDFYRMNPGINASECYRFYDNHHIICSNGGGIQTPSTMALINIAVDRSSATVLSTNVILQGCA